MGAASAPRRGLEAVERRDWQRAQMLLSGWSGLERSVPGLEGLSLACWWLDDGPGFLAARESLFHLSNMLARLGCTTRAEAVGVATSHDWLPAGASHATGARARAGTSHSVSRS